MSSDAIPNMICPPSPGRRRPRTVASSSAPAPSRASIESAPADGAVSAEMSRMTPKLSAENRNKYTPRRRTAAAMALLALLHDNASTSNSVEAFVQRRAPSVSSVRTIRIRGTGTSTSGSSSLNFRQDNDSSTATAQSSYYVPGMPMPSSGCAQPTTSSATSPTTTTNAAEFPDTEVRSRMPTWLQTTPQTPTEVDAALQTLRDAMITTYLTPSEAHTVLSAIQSSSAGNQSKMGGAAEFCHILVDTMEMGVTSLVAAVRHYCECYDVREREAAHGFSGGTTLLPSGGQSIEMFEMAAQAFASSEANLYGRGDSYTYPAHHGGTAATSKTTNTANDDEAGQIASDASGLKRTEAVARTTFRTQTRRRVHLAHQHQQQDPNTHVHRQDAYANMQNLLLSETRDWRSLAIRTAACLYRLRGLQAARDHGPAPAAPLTSEEVRQSRDALHIYAPLASRLGMHRLKNELEGAAFRLQYRRQYDRVMDLGREPRVIYDDNTNGNPNNPHALTVGEGMARVLRRVAENVKGVLDADPTFTEAAADVVVCARVKEPYSLWRKILKTGATRLLDVPDALALRVVLNAKKESPDEPDDVTAARERAMCYYVQSLCTTHWEPDLNKDGGRFKDYIDSPKPNGYQSLHYTASTWWGGVDWPLEIQVRTGEMHKIAEYGLAAHFDYKENAKRGGYAGESDPPVYRTYAGSRANANFHDSAAASAPPTRLNDESYLQAVQEWHWNQIDGAAYSSSPSYQQRRFEEVQGELNSKIGTGYSPDHDEDRAQRVRARAERIAPYIESFTAAQSDLARNHVFVFLASSEQNPANGGGPSGTIVSLPSGSCILDALREGAKHFPSVDSNCFQGKAHFGVQRNGMAASSVTEMLKNGDVITLPTVCNAGEVLTP